MPGGSLLTLSAMAGLAGLLGGFGTVGVLFLGLGGTFWLLSLVETKAGRMRWALIPAGVLALFGIVFVASATRAFVYVFGALMILGGVWIVVRALRGGRAV